MKRIANGAAPVLVVAMLVLVLMFGLGLSLSGSVSAVETTAVRVSAPSQTVDSGETFTVNIVVDPGVLIAGMQFNLTFDPSLVAVDSVEEGDLLAQNGASTYFNPGVIDNEAGTISGVVGVITSPGETVAAMGTFAIITMLGGTAEGTCPLTLSGVLVGDIEGQPVPVSVVDGEVAIDVNQPPELAFIGNKSVDEGDLLDFTISASDSDGDPLTYSAWNLPEGASFDPGTRTFSWTPRYNQAGVYPNVHFEVYDGGLTDSEDITITVIQLYEDWDVNGDEAVNVLDMVMVGQHWGEEGPAGWIREDVNEDGVVNVLDMILIGQHWTG